jgi:hypothetical protein
MYLYLADSQNGSEELTDDALEAVSGGVLQLVAGFLLGAGSVAFGTWAALTEGTMNNQEFLDNYLQD